MNLKTKLYKLLRKSEKYTKTDMVYLAKGMSWLTLGQIISSAATFGLAIAFANLLPKETYGTYKYILSLTGILTIFSLPGMGTAIIQAAARGYEGSFYRAFRVKLRWGALGSLAAFFLAGYYFLKGNHTLPIPLLISAVFLPLWQASSIYGSLLTGKKLFNFGVKYSAVRQIISVGAMISALLLSKNIIWIIAAYFASNTLSNCFLYLLTKKKFQPNKKEDPQTISYGKHLSLMGVLQTIAGMLDNILLWHSLGTAPVAIYSFSKAIPIQLRSALKNIPALAFPKFAQRDFEEIKKPLLHKMWKMFLLLIVLVGAYILMVPFIYKIFFPQYVESIFYSQLFALTLLFFPSRFIGITFQAHAHTKTLYTLSIITPLIKIALMIILIPLFGILGAITVELSVRLIGLSANLFLFMKTKS